MKQQLIFSEEVTNTMKIKSVKSFNPFKSLPRRLSAVAGQAGVILTIYDIVKVHGAKLVVDSGLGEGTTLILTIPTNS